MLERGRLRLRRLHWESFQPLPHEALVQAFRWAPSTDALLSVWSRGNLVRSDQSKFSQSGSDSVSRDPDYCARSSLSEAAVT